MDKCTASTQNKSSLCIITYFVDNEWKLQKRIISFFNVYGSIGFDICNHLLNCWLGWNIDQKLIEIIVDNDKVNDDVFAFDENYKQKVLTDTLFSSIHGMLLYNIWRGGSIDSDSSIMKILPSIEWHAITEGIASLPGSITFQSDGNVEVDWGASYDFVEFDEKTGEPILYSFGKQEGSYTVKDSIIYITWEKIIENEHSVEVPKKSVYILKREGVYGILRSQFQEQESFYDIPDECNL